jgi:hypothetical protein
MTARTRLVRGRWLLTAVTALGIAAAMLTVGEPSRAYAQEPPDAVPAPDVLRGAPEIRPDAPTGYYIWRDADGINLRTHGPRGYHHFRAVLHTDGVFVDVEAVFGELRDRVRVTNHGHTLILDVHTFDHIDGVNFRVRGGDWLSFDLELEGRQIPTNYIFLGSMQSHPDNNPFAVRLHGNDN